MWRVAIPSTTNDRAYIDTVWPGVFDKWVAEQPPGNYTVMDVVVDPRLDMWQVTLLIVKDPV